MAPIGFFQLLLEERHLLLGCQRIRGWRLRWLGGGSRHGLGGIRGRWFRRFTGFINHRARRYPILRVSSSRMRLKFACVGPYRAFALAAMLVSTAALAQHLNDTSWVIFDCRHDLMDFAKGERLYRAIHVAGAHFARVETELSGLKTGRNGRHPLREPQVFADFLGRHGVSPSSMIVAYDDVGGQYSARWWWMARWIGLRRVTQLDGGFSKWVAEGRPVTAEIPLVVPAELRARPEPELVWTWADVERQLGDKE